MDQVETTVINSVTSTVFFLLFAAAAVALITKYIRVPYTTALVIAGLLLALVPGLLAVELTPELIVSVFLPALVFEAGYNIKFAELRANWRSIAILAIPGVGLTATLVALMMNSLAGFAWPVAFLFGAIMSATDPVSVVGIFRQLGANRRLQLIDEGESLFNDGTAIVIFNLILGIIVAGNFNLANSVVEFVLVVAGGAAVGILLGSGFSLLLRQVNDYLLETLLTLLLAYGSFFVADQLQVSGIIAVAVSGLLVGNYDQDKLFSHTSKEAVSLSWELFGFLANSLIFLFVGLELRATDLLASWWMVLIAIVAVLLARTLVVALFSLLVNLLHIDERVPARWQAVLTWGGLRGALSLALALSIPLTLTGGGLSSTDREQVIAMTFGVILFSLLVQGLTMKPLLRALRLAGRAEELIRYEALSARVRLGRAAQRLLELRAASGALSPQLATQIRGDYEQRETQLLQQLDLVAADNEALRGRVALEERRALLQSEKSLLRELLVAGEINEETMRELNAELDERLHAVEHDATTAS